jgi:hypothetical protein
MKRWVKLPKVKNKKKKKEKRKEEEEVFLYFLKILC